MLKRSALLLILTLLLGITATFASAVTLLNPPGHGVPGLSKNKLTKPLNKEMLASLADGKYFVKLQSGLSIKTNPEKRTYNSSFALPDKAFSILCNLSVEQGSIDILAGNIKIHVLPDRAEIYQDGKLIKTQERKGIRGVGFERGYDFNNKMTSIARIYSDTDVGGAEVTILIPAKISIAILPKTVGSLGNWEWVRGTK